MELLTTTVRQVLKTSLPVLSTKAVRFGHKVGQQIGSNAKNTGLFLIGFQYIFTYYHIWYQSDPLWSQTYHP